MRVARLRLALGATHTLGSLLLIEGGHRLVPAIRPTLILWLAAAAILGAIQGRAEATGPGVVATIPVGDFPFDVALSPDSQRVYVTTEGIDGGVSVIDTGTQKLITTISLGSSPTDIAISPDGAWAYVAMNDEAGTISIIDTAANAFTGSLPVGDHPQGVAITPDGTKLYVTNAFSNTVSVFDLSGRTLLATVPVGLAPRGVGISSDGQNAYVANGDSNDVSIINTATDVVKATVSVGTFPIRLAVARDGSHVYVANAHSGDLSVIDTGSAALSRTIALGNGPFDVALAPDGDRVLVTLPMACRVAVVNLISNTVEARVPVGDGPGGIASSADGTMYVANHLSGDLSVIRNTSQPLPRRQCVFAAPFSHTLGDADCDSQITSLDALAVLRFTARLPGPAPCIGVGDTNCDGSADVVDALDILRQVAGLPEAPRPESCAALSNALAAATADQEADGWSLNCWNYPRYDLRDVAGSLDGINWHRVAVYCKNGGLYPGSTTEKVVMYELQGSDLVPLLTLDQPLLPAYDPHFSIYESQGSQSPVFRLAPSGPLGVGIMNESECNGAECSYLRLYTVREHAVEEIPVHLPATGLLGFDHNGDGTSAIPYAVEDVDGDGTLEVIASDAAWEIHGFCHACSPYGVFVLGWDGQAYHDASGDQRFRVYFDATIAELESGVAPGINDESRLSYAISIALLYGHSGRADLAWQRFEDISGGLQLPSCIQALPLYRADLELSVPKDGSVPQASVPGSPELTWSTCLVVPPW